MKTQQKEICNLIKQNVEKARKIAGCVIAAQKGEIVFHESDDLASGIKMKFNSGMHCVVIQKDIITYNVSRVDFLEYVRQLNPPETNTCEITQWCALQ